jgi:hypothetical protein
MKEASSLPSLRSFLFWTSNAREAQAVLLAVDVASSFTSLHILLELQPLTTLLSVLIGPLLPLWKILAFSQLPTFNNPSLCFPLGIFLIILYMILD